MLNCDRMHDDSTVLCVPNSVCRCFASIAALSVAISFSALLSLGGLFGKVLSTPVNSATPILTTLPLLSLLPLLLLFEGVGLSDTADNASACSSNPCFNATSSTSRRSTPPLKREANAARSRSLLFPAPRTHNVLSPPLKRVYACVRACVRAYGVCMCVCVCVRACVHTVCVYVCVRACVSLFGAKYSWYPWRYGRNRHHTANAILIQLCASYLLLLSACGGGRGRSS